MGPLRRAHRWSGDFWRFGPRYSNFATIKATKLISPRPMRRRRFGVRTRSQSMSSFSYELLLPSRQRSRCRRPPRRTFCGFPTLRTALPTAISIDSSPISSACFGKRSQSWSPRAVVPADRRDRLCVAVRSHDPRQDCGRGRRSRCADRALHRFH